MKTGHNGSNIASTHKMLHLARGEKYSEHELEEIIRRFNNQTTSSRQEEASEEVQKYHNNEPLHQLNFSNMQPSQDKGTQNSNSH